MLKKYFTIWFKTSLLSLQSALVVKGASAMYIAGKFIRFFIFLILLFTIVGRLKNLAGYSLSQILTFFLIFNLFDMFGQIFFRGIYWFRGTVLSGKFDFTLTKPANPLFLSLTTRTDLLDLPLLLVVIFMLFKQPLFLNFGNLLTFLLISISGILIVTAVHIFVACLGVAMLEVDHAMMIYRDLSAMARFPIDIYVGWLRALLTFVIPIGVAYTFPAKALMGILSWPWLLYSLFVSSIIFLASLKVWHFSLKKYSSVSS